jgi:hypothetical protein
MSMNNMRYVITKDGAKSGEGWVLIDDNDCHKGYLIMPFLQDYVYKVTAVEGYDITLEPFCEKSKAVHNATKTR